MKIIRFIILWFFRIILFPIFIFIIVRNIAERDVLKAKLKHYKPIVKHTAMSTFITWELRDTPLSDKDVRLYFKNKKDEPEKQ